MEWDDKGHRTGDWWFRCSHCGEQGFREKFDLASTALDRILELPMTVGIGGARQWSDLA